MKENRTSIKVSFFQRKPRPVGNYSIEYIFRDVRQQLRNLVESREVFSKYESSGLFKRLYNCLEAVGQQGEVNHVTGDINYLGIFLKKQKTIQTIHDCVHVTFSTGLRRSILQLFWITIPVRRCQIVTANSNSTKQEILKYTNCDPDKINVIHVAISERFKKKDTAFNAENPRILQLGTAVNKNIPRLIEALKGIPCILDIVGTRDPLLEKLLKNSGMNYEYSWGLSDEEIIAKYEASDIVSLASTYEGFGMPILEAQAVGRPVITSNIFSMPEVAGDAACLVDPFDISSIRTGMLKIIIDPSYREDLVKKGYENVKRFDARDIALQYYKLYQKIARRN